MREAKLSLKQFYKDEDNVLGVGMGDKHLILYVKEEDPLLEHQWRGFDVLQVAVEEFWAYQTCEDS